MTMDSSRPMIMHMNSYMNTNMNMIMSMTKMDMELETETDMDRDVVKGHQQEHGCGHRHGYRHEKIFYMTCMIHGLREKARVSAVFEFLTISCE
jgi:hypothetical protein